MWHMCSYEKSGNSTDYPSDYLWYGRKVLRRILGISLQVAQHKTKNGNGLPLPNWRTKRKNQPSTGRLPTKLYQLWSERLVRTVAIGQMRIQQLSYQCTRNDSLLRKLRFSSANRMDKGTRSVKPRPQLYAHWMQTIHVQTQDLLERTRERMSKYYDRKASNNRTLRLAIKSCSMQKIFVPSYQQRN